MNQVSEGATDTLEQTKGLFSGLTDFVGNTAKKAYGAVEGTVGAVENAGQGVLNVAKQGVQTVGNAANSTANTVTGAITGTGGKRGKMSKKMIKQMKKMMNKSLQNKVKKSTSYNITQSVGGRRYRGGYSNYSVTSTFPSGVYDMASPYPSEAYGTPMPLPSNDPMPTLAQRMRGGNYRMRGGNVNQVQLPAGGLQVNVEDAAGNSVRSMGIALPSPVNIKVTTGGRRHKSRRHSRKGGKSRKSQKGCSKKMSWGGKRGRKSRKSHKY
jgi:hypothetical protein